MAKALGRKKIAIHEEKHHQSLELKVSKVLGNQKILFNKLESIEQLFINTNLKLNLIIQNQNNTMTKAELKAALGAIATQLNKAKDEILAAMSESGNVDQETTDAVNAISGIAQALDDLNPDGPPPPPAEPPV